MSVPDTRIQNIFKEMLEGSSNYEEADKLARREGFEASGMRWLYWQFFLGFYKDLDASSVLEEI